MAEEPDNSTEEVPPIVSAEADAIEDEDDDPNPSDANHDGTIISRAEGVNDGTETRLRRILKLMASPLTDEKGSFFSVVGGLATILLAGTLLGLVASPNKSLSPSYRRISAAIGYTYFMAWR